MLNLFHILDTLFVVCGCLFSDLISAGYLYANNSRGTAERLSWCITCIAYKEEPNACIGGVTLCSLQEPNACIGGVTLCSIQGTA